MAGENKLGTGERGSSFPGLTDTCETDAALQAGSIAWVISGYGIDQVHEMIMLTCKPEMP
jgi:hypothetical protein